MLSRLAQNLFWAGRYLERAESGARLINATTLLLLDLPRQTEFDWRALVEIVGAEALFARHYPDATEESVMRFLSSDRDHPGSIASSLAHARENLRHTREIERESGGFQRYLQNQTNSQYAYNFGRPPEDYRDKFEKAARAALAARAWRIR